MGAPLRGVHRYKNSDDVFVADEDDLWGGGGPILTGIGVRGGLGEGFGKAILSNVGDNEDRLSSGGKGGGLQL